MTFPALKRGVFILEGLNGLGCSLYFNYLFFFLQNHFQFGNRGNLVFCAINGFIYIFGSLYGGRFAQRRGYFNALQLGWAVLTVALLISAVFQTVAMLLAAMCLWTIGVCFTWPSLEALTCEGESTETLPRKVGIYNVVWSATYAFGYFIGGAIVERVGWRSIFLIPAALHVVQLLYARHLAANARAPWTNLAGAPPTAVAPPTDAPPRSHAKSFLRMAWLANPFAYIAMNTVIPLMPDIAARLQLSPAHAGFICSIWMFSRMASFVLLWKWTGWHYRFRWMIGAYALLIVNFAALLLVPNLWAFVLIQIAFGFAVGLIYYSSLFYSMDSSDTKGEHGGVHEAAIGSGIFLGPTIGFAALHFFPSTPNSSAVAVSAALSLGMFGLLYLRKR